jgi:hypothetical protein
MADPFHDRLRALTPLSILLQLMLVAIYLLLLVPLLVWRWLCIRAEAEKVTASQAEPVATIPFSASEPARR